MVKVFHGFMCALGFLILSACGAPDFHPLPNGDTSVAIVLNLSSTEWTVSVRNKAGEASSKMVALNDHRRSNIYLTPRHQLVVIEQGGIDAFFMLARDAAPMALDRTRIRERDVQDNAWRYVGVIEGALFLTPDMAPECIALLGEGRSPYRKAYQVSSFC